MCKKEAYLDNPVLLDGQASALALQLGRGDQPLYFGSLGVGLALAVCVLPSVHSHIAAAKVFIQRAKSLGLVEPNNSGPNSWEIFSIQLES